MNNPPRLTAPATPIDLAFLDEAEKYSYPGQNKHADFAALYEYRHIAHLRTFKDRAAQSGLGAAVIVRVKSPGFIAPNGVRLNWEPAQLIMPRSVSDFRLARLLYAPEPPLLVQEEQLAINMLRELAEGYFDMLSGVSQMWNNLHLGRGRKSVDLYPEKGWQPNPPASQRRSHYSIHESSVCSQWVALNGGALMPPKLARERKILQLVA